MDSEKSLINRDFSDYVVFGDVAMMHKNGSVNKHNFHIILHLIHTILGPVNKHSLEGCRGKLKEHNWLVRK